jgi:hypothetical protein
MVLVAALASIGWAAEDEDPGRGVARVSLINGDVSVRRGDSGEWVAAAINAPLVAGDQLLTGAGARVELQFDWANVVRLSADAEIHLADLEANRYTLQLARGTATFSVLRDTDAQVEIDTPSVSVRPLRKGDYRIYVADSGEVEITVRSGEADVFTPQGSERLGAGKTLFARGPASDPEYQVRNAVAYDDWDRWNADRNQYFDRSASYRYVDSSVYGAEDLDGYGSWVWAPPYGYVWAPQVDAGWAPYSDGRWSWIDYYGWSWVSYDPWGWAPFHYGRWFYNQPYGWCWWPGAMHTRHYWSPGLVAFFGYGGWNGMGVGFGAGSIGWVPLAPNETYHPWYGRDVYRGYRNTTAIGNSVHVVNNANIVSVYRNARVTGGVSAVDATQFGRGNRNVVRLSANDLGSVDLVNGQLPVAPVRESLRVSNRDVTPMPAARGNAQQRFFSPKPAPQVERVPFAQQQRSMQQATRRTVTQPAATQPQAPAPQVNTNPGWRRFDSPPPARQPAPQVDTNRDRGSAPMQISPPIVRERQAVPSQPAPAPRMEAPRQVAPPPQAAPRMEAPRQVAPPPQAAPRMEAPRQAAPPPQAAPQQAAPQQQAAPPQQAAPARSEPAPSGNRESGGDNRGTRANPR